MKDLSVICCGLTQMIELDGEYLPVVLVIVLDKILQSNLTRQMDFN
jgi:hypothetical protein